MKGSKKAMLAALAGAAGMLLTIALISIAMVYSGAYNIAATEDHASLVRWAFDTTFRRSVEARAEPLQPPATLTGLAQSGAHEYKAMCQHCHGGAGVEPATWTAGMRPKPPLLTEEASEWDVSEVFWLVKHGAKMTGMPAFGPTHDDQTLWGIAAFVRQLPAMTPERYAALSSGDSGHHTSH